MYTSLDVKILFIYVKSTGDHTVPGWSLSIAWCYHIQMPADAHTICDHTRKNVINRLVPGQFSNLLVHCKLLKSYGGSFICDHRITKSLSCYPPPQAKGYRFGIVCPDVQTSSVHHKLVGSHWGEVHCTRTITLHCLILELLPFMTFHTWILCGTYLSDYKRHQHETL